MNIEINFLDIEKEITFFEEFKKALVVETAEPKDFEDIEGRVMNERVDMVYKNMELSYLFSELMFKVAFLKRFSLELPERINNFFNEHSSQMYKRNFCLEQGVIKEVREGLMEEKRKEFLESPLYKNIKEQLKTSSQ